MEKTQAKPLTAAQQCQRDKKRRTWLRTGVQLFFFVSMPGAFVAGFSGVKQIFLHIGAGEVLSVDSFTLSLLGLCGFTLLFDRFFCGYACAFGSLGDAVWALSGLIQKKLFHRKKQLRLPERAVLLGQKVKYLLLAWLVALYVTRQEKMLTGASPWEVFSRLTALHLPPEGFGVGLGLLVLILLGMAVQPRFFCQFLCPMGAVFALLPVLPFARLHRQSDGCIPGCNACKQQCPVCLKLEETSLRSGECIACEACVGTCPKQNIHRWDMALCKSLWLPVLGKALLFSCWAAGWVSAGLSEQKRRLLRSICAAASFWLGDLSFRYAGASTDAPVYYFHREDFCSNRSVMLRRLMPRCLWPPRRFQTVQKSPPFPLSPSSQIPP